MRTTLALVISGMLTTSIAAQTPETRAPALAGGSPSECVRLANTWRAKAWADAPQKTAVASASLLAEARRGARDCGLRFATDTTPSVTQQELVTLHTFTGDTTAARIALGRAMRAPSASVRERGDLLVQAVRQEITASNGYFGVIEGAELYVAQIDALSDEAIDAKFAAHETMLGRYEYLDVAPGLEKHAKAVLDLARRTNRKTSMLSAYTSLARSAGDMLRPADAIRILDEAEKEMGSTPDVIKQLAYYRDRYALIGTKAATVTGQWWVGSTDSLEKVVPGNGKVTLVEFTAHWCAPCRNSYPGMKSLAERFAGKAFQGVMVTSLYGYIGARRPLTPEQEVEADREYFGKEHALPYKVAINPPADRSVDNAYRVGGIPQIMIVDKKGVIRQIVIGWDQGNTARFTRYIETLLAER